LDAIKLHQGFAKNFLSSIRYFFTTKIKYQINVLLLFFFLFLLLIIIFFIIFIIKNVNFFLFFA